MAAQRKWASDKSPHIRMAIWLSGPLQVKLQNKFAAQVKEDLKVVVRDPRYRYRTYDDLGSVL